ncbi:nucleotidyltransferase domain-containing protein [Paenibacillus sp. FJAT-26967]|uniref:nucleotidyltransferase domain-containing protein n=1 Tax=Paenibacillus sp. FJAT-26967 TaxID=1729690 RepID=UPI003462DCC0
MLLPVHKRFVCQAKEQLSQDRRVRGLLAGGSMMTNTMDEYSDLDLIIVYNSAYQEQIMNQRLLIAEGLGNCFLDSQVNTLVNLVWLFAYTDQSHCTSILNL